MLKPPHVIDIFLQPGDFYFGDQDTRIRTLLGSCVSITMWHPQKLIGGMCHYVLPTKRMDRENAGPGHYADEVMKLFVNEIIKSKTYPYEYQVKVFGGGNMLKFDDPHCEKVPCRNITVARELLKLHGFKIAKEDLGGNEARTVMLDIWSGNTWLKKTKKA